MMKPFLLSSMLLAISLMASAQPRFSQAHGLYDQESLTVELATDDGAAEIRYTTDGCPPTAESQLYTGGAHADADHCAARRGGDRWRADGSP